MSDPETGKISQVFKTSYLDKFRNNSGIISALNGVKLYNYEEFIEWYSPNEIRQSKRLRTNEEGHSKDVLKEVMEISRKTLEELSTSVCDDNIAPEYGSSSIRNLKNDNFDLLVAISNKAEDTNIDIHKKTKTVSRNKLQNVLGFIIVEKGECKKKPELYSVNLICAKSNSKYGKVKGTILLGAFLYCNKLAGGKKCILELADGYTNVVGFFAYSKLGFDRDLELYEPTQGVCFYDMGNLPMSVNLTKYTENQIIGFVTGSQKRTDTNDPTGFIKLIPQTDKQKKIQSILAKFLNIQYKFKELSHEDIGNFLEQDIPDEEMDIIDKLTEYDLKEYDNSVSNLLNEKINELKNNFSNPNFSLDEFSGGRRNRNKTRRRRNKSKSKSKCRSKSKSKSRKKRK